MITHDRRLSAFDGRHVRIEPLVNKDGTVYGHFYEESDEGELIILECCKEEDISACCDDCRGIHDGWDQVVIG